MLLQIAQRAEDLSRASAFYESLLGVPPAAAFDPPGLLFFDLGGVRLLLERGAPTAVHYLRVTDLGSRIEALRSEGVTVESEPHCIFVHTDDTLGPAGFEEWHAFIRDSEGNLVGLVELRAADPA
jgi:catechol 2,3-dioxygenase-like lactoylglutathione lyase family enzyme